MIRMGEPTQSSSALHRAAASSLVVALVLASFALADPPAPPVNRAEALFLKPGQRGPAERAQLADELMKLYEDPASRPEEKAAALYRRMMVQFYEESRYGAEGWAAKAEETYDFYAKNFRGKLPNSDGAMATLYCDLLVFEIKQGKKEKLEPLLTAVAGLAQYRGLGVPETTMHKYRALGYYYAGETQKGDQIVRDALKQGKKLPYDTYMDVAQVYADQKRFDEAFSYLAEGLMQYSDNAVSGLLSDKLATVGAAGNIGEPRLLDAFVQVLLSPKAVKPVLGMLISRRTESGDAAGALAYAKLYYDLAPLDEIEGAIDVVSRCLRTVDMDVVRTNQFLEFQKFGPGGPDGKATGNDALVNPLAQVKSPLPPETLKALSDLAAKTLPAGERVYEPLRDRATVALALGRPQEALALYRAAYSASSIGQVKEVSALVPRALKAVDGGVWRVNLYLKYQKCGPAGEDGVAGNADDLTDPLAQEKLPPLPEDVTRALAAVAAKSGGAMNLCEARGYAFLAMGRFDKGFNQMRAAFSSASSDPKMLARGIEDVAAAIKAYDGHVHRANQYLLYQKQNGKTADGKAMENPLPTIMAQIGVAR